MKTAEKAVYELYKGMIARCYNKNHRSYKTYGGAGIVVCDRWRGRGGFVNFCSDMLPRPQGMTLHRERTAGPYSPDNCRWATPREQGNARVNNRLITFKGKTQTMTEWARKAGFKPQTIQCRLSAGWSVERALTERIMVSKIRNK